jgi:hypothetical protein
MGPNVKFQFSRNRLYRRTDFIVVWYPVTSNGLPSNSRFRYHGNAVKVNRRVWTSMCNIFAQLITYKEGNLHISSSYKEYYIEVVLMFVMRRVHVKRPMICGHKIKMNVCKHYTIYIPIVIKILFRICLMIFRRKNSECYLEYCCICSRNIYLSTN